MFENVDGRRTTDAGVTGILIAHLGAFGSGELKIKKNLSKVLNTWKYYEKMTIILNAQFSTLSTKA